MVSCLKVRGSVVVKPGPRLVHIFIGLVGGTIRTIRVTRGRDLRTKRRRGAKEIFVDLEGDVGRKYCSVTFRSGNSKIDRRGRSGLFAPGFAAGDSNANLKLTVYQGVVRGYRKRVRCRGSLLKNTTFVIAVPGSASSRS